MARRMRHFGDLERLLRHDDEGQAGDRGLVLSPPRPVRGDEAGDLRPGVAVDQCGSGGHGHRGWCGAYAAGSTPTRLATVRSPLAQPVAVSRSAPDAIRLVARERGRVAARRRRTARRVRRMTRRSRQVANFCTAGIPAESGGFRQAVGRCSEHRPRAVPSGFRAHHGTRTGASAGDSKPTARTICSTTCLRAFASTETRRTALISKPRSGNWPSGAPARAAGRRASRPPAAERGGISHSSHSPADTQR